MDSPVLSICLITYNHIKYINEAIEGVLMQKVDFSYEFIIADDFSNDGTREILLGYQKKYPNVIKLILQEKNVGAAKNWLDLINSPKGKYIAYFEGDDYWIDRDKLQKQINILENNALYVGCFHNAEERYEDDDSKASFLYCNYPGAQRISFADLSYGNPIPTCSIVYRNKLFDEFPEWWSNLKMGDWPLHLLNAQYGDFYYLPKIMAVHRIHGKSSWTLQGEERNRRYLLDAYDIMINGFSKNRDLQKQLVIARKAFIGSNGRSASIVRRGINFIRRLTS